MLTHIQNLKDVAAFAKQLIAEKVSFHPDDDFNDYIFFDTRKSCYSKDDAFKRNKLMDDYFTVCEKEGADIYNLMLEVTLKETGMDKFIPLPSAMPQA